MVYPPTHPPPTHIHTQTRTYTHNAHNTHVHAHAETTHTQTHARTHTHKCALDVVCVPYGLCVALQAEALQSAQQSARNAVTLAQDVLMELSKAPGLAGMLGRKPAGSK